MSHTQSIFDRMGYLSPATIIPKILLQRSWKTSKTWDEKLDEKIEKEFREWWEQAELLERVRITRFAFGGESIQLHGFSDASQNAYSAAVFIRVEYGGSVKCHLLQAKSRVAPIRPTTTIPRLELLGCVILARMMMTVVEAMSLQDVPKYYWTDSSTALAWVKRNSEWGTFVGNRVKEICKLSSPQEWSHVPGKQNPADLPSRSCTPKKLLDSRWWEGPEWLRKPREEWPTCEEITDEESVKKSRKEQV